MSFRSITAFIHNADTDAKALGSAAAIAQARDAHLTAICLGLDRTNPGAYYAGASAIALQETMVRAQEEAAANEKAAEAALGVWSIPFETQNIVAQIGALGPVVAERAQMSDLIVLPQPYGADRRVEDVVIAEAALFRTRVPVLVLPDGDPADVAPGNVVIAWNESPQALAAVRGAMPFLKAAENVDIAIIDPPVHGADRSDPGGALAAMLSRHGVRANVTVLAKTMSRVSDVIGRHLEDKSADMLVMGAYGHSRFVEAVLGGATRNLLEDAKVPVLMAH
jgi:nucleotide-binding universal stress UspA family protein